MGRCPQIRSCGVYVSYLLLYDPHHISRILSYDPINRNALPGLRNEPCFTQYRNLQMGQRILLKSRILWMGGADPFGDRFQILSGKNTQVPYSHILGTHRPFVCPLFLRTVSLVSKPHSLCVPKKQSVAIFDTSLKKPVHRKVNGFIFGFIELL